MYSYRLNKTKDADFFSAPHYDAISTAQIKDGDVVCVCNDCEELFLESSWEANDKHCSKCGGTSRKNIDERYFRKYRINTQRVLKTRNRGAVSGRRRNMVSLGTLNRPSQPVNTVARRPVGNTSGYSNRGAATAGSAPRRTAGAANTAGRPRQTINPRPYPNRKKPRKKTGRILLGIVVSVILIAVAVGTLCVLDHNGVIDLSGAISSLTDIMGLELAPKGLAAGPADVPLPEPFDLLMLP